MVHILASVAGWFGAWNLLAFLILCLSNSKDSDGNEFEVGVAALGSYAVATMLILVAIGIIYGGREGAMSANKGQVGGDHYQKREIQPWDTYEDWLGRDGFAAYLNGTIIKYLVRYKDKGGVVDLQKARHCLDKLIEVESPRKEH